MSRVEQRRLVAVTGGIGSGKSVVCRILSALGHEVYDCDSRAKWLMDNSAGIKEELCRAIHPDVVKDGCIDRSMLSGIVFSDACKLQALNSIVHGAVLADIARWAETKEGNIFVETAILYQSGLDRMVDEVWEVTAPEHMRVERVMKRNGMPEADVRARINSQVFEPGRRHARVRQIVNDGLQSLLLRIDALLCG